MASKKNKVNERLLAAAEATPPANPAITSSDLSFLRGLKRRGYTDIEIISIASKASLRVNPDQLLVVKRVKKVAATTTTTTYQQHGNNLPVR